MIGPNVQALYRAQDEGLLPTPPWIMDDLLTSGRGLIIGRPKVGKSYAAAQIADALHHQKPLWWAGAPRRPYRTLYIQLDTPLPSMLQQLRGFVPGTDFGVAHYQHPDPEWRIDRFCLGETPKRQHAIAVVKRYQPDFVVWDGLTFLSAGLNLNERQSVMVVYKLLEMVWDGPHLLICHANQSRELEERHAVERVAGNKAITADADYFILIESENDKQGRWAVVNRLTEPRHEKLLRVGKGLPGSGSWIMDTTPPPQPSGRRIVL